MTNTNRFWGAVLAAALAATGCATTGGRSSSVSVQPIADGRASQISRFELAFDGQPGGRVVLAEGAAVHETRASLIHLRLRVENTEGTRTLTVPTDQLYLAQLGAQPIPPAEIDGGAPPESLAIAPGESKSFDLVFPLPPPLRVDDVRAFSLHWALDADGQERTARTTEFAANEKRRIYGAPVDQADSDAHYSQLPSAPKYRQESASSQRFADPPGLPRQRTKLPVSPF